MEGYVSMQSYQNYIGGEWVAPLTGNYSEIRNPAQLDEIVGRAPSSGLVDLEQAVAAATAAFPAWAGRAAPERGRILHKVANIIEGQIDAWAAELTREEGKTRTESRMEVVRAVELFRYFAGEAWRVGGDVLPADTPNTLLYSVRVPLGVVAIITPWNFPLSIPVWKMAPALVMGNTVVIKPASATPIMALRLMGALHEAGLPAGVVNCITGSGSLLGDALISDQRVKAVSFTGSYTIGHALYQKTAPRLVRTHLEMGGKNPVIVAADADLDKAVSIVVRGGFGLTGQACTATSRVIVDRAVAKEFSARLAAAAQKIVVGPGLADGVQMGPAVSASQRDIDLAYVEIANEEGATVVAGGTAAEGNGYFVKPTVLTGVRPDMRVAQEEVFGPVIGIIEVGDMSEAITVCNNVAYGLSATIVTNDVRNSIRFAEQAEAGMLKVNQPTAGVSIQAPFGGFKQSGSGMFREMGKGAVEFFTQQKTIYIDGQ
jgi:aldehyde dehydrogenase (NAD+)